MKYRVKVKMKMNREVLNASLRKCFVLQQKLWFFWVDMHTYYNLQDAQTDCDDFNRINGSLK